MSISLRRLSLIILHVALFSLTTGCEDISDSYEDVGHTDIIEIEVSPTEKVESHRRFIITEFEGFADPTTGELSLGLPGKIPNLTPEKHNFIHKPLNGDWGMCFPNEVSDSIPYDNPPDTIELQTVPGSIHLDEDCGSNPLYGEMGAFCGIIDLSWFGSSTLPNVYAEITFLDPPSGHAGWFDAPTPGMENGPDSNLGLFFYGDIQPGGRSRIQWVFERFDDFPFYFTGRIVSLAPEICGNEVDDNCNGQINEGCPVCGDGNLDYDEGCDDGNMLNDDGCNNDCTIPGCGNGMIESSEECDDGNNNPGDGCSPGCMNESCGDNIVQLEEECDDGNVNNGDGCTSTCKFDLCGNEDIDPGEQCDGDIAENYFCTSDCRLSLCGNGFINGPEECDDGNKNSGDGCSSVCVIESCDDQEICDGVDNDCDGIVDNMSVVLCNSGETCVDGSCVSVAGSCLEILERNWLAPDGFYDIQNNSNLITVYCDMTTNGGGFIDLVKTMNNPGADLERLKNLFFVSNNSFAIIISTGYEVSTGAEGFYIINDTTGDYDHRAGFHFKSFINYSEVIVDYRMQGSDYGYSRCSSMYSIPLNGPGYDGGWNRYLSYCLEGYTCIQGSPTQGRDAPIRVEYQNDNIDSSNTLLTWAGSGPGHREITACGRDTEIPTANPTTFFTYFLIR